MNFKKCALSAGRLLRMIWKESPWLVVALCINTALVGIMPSVDAYALKRIIEVCSQPSPTMQRLLPWILMILFSTAVMAGASLLNHKLSEISGQILLSSLRRGMMDKMARIDLSHFDRTEFKNRYQQAMGQINGNITSILLNLLGALRGIVTFVSFAIMLAQINWWILAAEILLVVPMHAISIRREDRFFSIALGRTPTIRRMNYYADILTSPKEQPELRVYDSQELFRGKYEETFNEQIRSIRQALKYDNCSDAIKAGITLLGVGFSYTILCLQVIRGILSVADLTLAASASVAVLSGGENIVGNFAATYRIVLFFQKYDEFMSDGTDMPIRKGIVPTEEINCISFRNVTFRYPGMNRDVLNNVSFDMKKGQATALVGINGAGKSTIIKLILRIYRPDSGTIYCNGVDIADIPLENYYKEVSTILQGYAQYALTLEESVLLGHGGDLQTALQKAGLQRFVDENNGDTGVAITRQFDPSGVQPSGGQWQKIALARAFAKPASILLLDEPSAALDPAAECELYENIFRTCGDKITLFVSHRMISTVFADQILLLKDGSIVEQGTHDELIARNGAYAKMFVSVEKLYSLRREAEVLECTVENK